MSRDCPYCGASFVEGWSGRIFKCGTDIGRHHGDFRHWNCYKREVTQLRAELLRCYNVIPGVEKVDKSPDLILGGCVSDTIHAFTTQQDAKIKQLEDELADYLTQCATLKASNCNLEEAVKGLFKVIYCPCPHDDSVYYCRSCVDALEFARKAKGTPHA